MIRRRSRKINKKKLLSDIVSSDEVTKFLSMFMNEMDAVKTNIYIGDLSKRILEDINDVDYKPTLREKIEKFFVDLFYKEKIKKIINDLTPEQLLMTVEGKYTSQITKRILFGTKLPPVDKSSLEKNPLSSAQLAFFNSILGKTLIGNIKDFVNKMPTDKMIMLIRGKIDITDPVIHAIMYTDYKEPSLKELEKMKGEEKEGEEEGEEEGGRRKGKEKRKIFKFFLKDIQMSDAELVKTFTEESGSTIPKEPQLMTKEEVFFLIKMMMDEIMELGATVADSHEVKLKMIKMIVDSKDIKQLTEYSKEGLIAEQADALVDCYYYSLNAAAKKGVNLSKIFQLVHSANMSKKDPTTGKFIKRDDGKIIKPEGWFPPNIIFEIIRQFKEGPFDVY